MDIFKEAREFCMERLEPEFLSEEEEKAYREAAEGTPEWEAYLEAQYEAYVALEATPEHEDYMEAKETKEKARKDYMEAWEAKEAAWEAVF